MALEIWNPANQYQHLRAGPSIQESFVLFINTTQRSVDLCWIDWDGREKFYHNLQSKQTIKANTFCNHAWVFRDTESGERMQVAHQFIFWPQAYRVRNQMNVLVPCRKQIVIHLPILNLRELCLWKLAKVLNDEDSIKDLYLPKTIQSDLHLYVMQSIEYNRR